MRRRNVIALVLLVIYLGLVAWCCFGRFDNIPGVGRDLFGIPTDKVAHFILFFPFPFLCSLAFNFTAKGPRKAILAVAATFLVGCVVAAGTEIGQSFTGYRSADPRDFLSDVVSLAVASGMVLAIYYRKRKEAHG